MFCPLGHSPDDRLEVKDDWFSQPVQLVKTAHFGATFLRCSALKKVPKPWFQGKANESGEYNGGHIDDDIAFWHAWEAAGNTLGVSTHVSVGHAELMITWPSREVPGGKIHQHTTDYWSKDQKAPKGAWGFVP